MSTKEFKAPREIKAIQQEYANTCTRAGEAQYKITALTKDLNVLNESLRDLNFEYVAASEQAQRAAAEAAKASETTKTEEPTNVTSINQEKSNG